VFGDGELAEVPISQAIAASSSIPGFFEPFAINGRHFVDGDVGYTGHADLAIDAGARALLVVNPLVPLRTTEDGQPHALRRLGLYGILEQVGRINSQNLLEGGLRELKLRIPDVRCHLIQPPSVGTPLLGPSMGFDASRAALRFGYTSTREWLERAGESLREDFADG
jgi:predicted acylesterase/phospholipase RssA